MSLEAIDWSSVVDVVDGLLAICGALVVYGSIGLAFYVFAHKDDC